MTRRTSGFTLVEVVVAVMILGLLLVVLVPMAGRARNGDGYSVSKFNLSRIMQATIQYVADHGGRVPLRGAGYGNGQLTVGWDNWNVGGKNCAEFWTGAFDESAYARFLNPYLYSARIPQPPGYINTSSGATWTFNHGTPTAQQRLLEIPAFRSPGDVESRQRSWPNPTPGVSAYNDVGTSYLANMKWWGMPLLPGTYSERYEAGLILINQAFNGGNPNFAFMHDQTADIVSNMAPSSSFQMLGEFGKVNASMMGFADGRVEYVGLVTGAMSGPGYSFAP